jgi:hypothetical protein
LAFLLLFSIISAKAVRTSPHIDGFLFPRDVFCLIRPTTQSGTSYGEASDPAVRKTQVPKAQNFGTIYTRGQTKILEKMCRKAICDIEPKAM